MGVRIALGTLLLLSACTATVPAGSGPSDPPVPRSTAARATPDVVGVTYHPTWEEMTPQRRATVLDRLRAAGVTWLRVDVSWKEFQPWDPDSYDPAAVAAFDERMAEISARGFDVLLMFYWAPAWSTGTTEMSGPPADPASFARAAAWAVDRWGADIDAVEIWNEPDSPRFWTGSGARFARLLVKTSDALRATDPDLPVIAGGTSRVDVGWWRDLLRRPGVANAVDAIGVHPYTVPSDLGPRAADNGKPWRVRHLAALAPVSRRYDLPVWVTEYGWSSGTGPDPLPYERGVDESTQALYLNQALEEFARHDWIHAAFWYTDIDHGTGDPHQDGFGLLRRDGSPKPAYFALQCTVSGQCGPAGVSP